MPYLIGEIIICMLIAAIFGFLIGWFLRRYICNRKIAELEEIWKAEAPVVAAAKEPEPALYVGNKNPQSMELHKRDCRWVKRISDKNKVFFNDKEEAFARGFDGCAYCIPERHTR